MSIFLALSKARHILPYVAELNHAVALVRLESPLVGLCGLFSKVTEPRCLHTTHEFHKEDRKMMIASLPARDEGVEGEYSGDIDISRRSTSMFPDADTPNMLVDGVRFAELPIIHIRVSKNNTIMWVVDHKGVVLLRNSCGYEGFKNAKKGTNIAAQATAISLCQKAAEIGVKNVRITIKGLGPGRMASLKGLQMGGINIVSITDTTPAIENGLRPRKQRRI